MPGQQKGPTAVTVTSGKATIGERLDRIDALDLEPIVYKLIHPEPGETALSLPEADRDVGAVPVLPETLRAVPRCHDRPYQTARPCVAHAHAGHGQVPRRL